MATLDPVTNFASSLVATAPSPATTGTSLIVSTGEGTLFPDPSAEGAYNLTVWPATDMPTVSNAEIVRVTAKSTDTLTITRQQEGTSARTVVVGDRIALTPTEKLRDDIEDNLGGADPRWECTIGASGADYTTLGAAVVAGKKRILVIDDTTETGNITFPDNLVLWGSQPDTAIDIDLVTYQVTSVPNYFDIRNVSFTSSRASASGGGIFEAQSDYFYWGMFENCYFTSTNNDGYVEWFGCALRWVQFNRCRFASDWVRLIYQDGSAKSLGVQFNNCEFSMQSILEECMRFDVDEDGVNPGVQFNNCRFTLGDDLLYASESSGDDDQINTYEFNHCNIQTNHTRLMYASDTGKIVYNDCHIYMSLGTSEMVAVGSNCSILFSGCTIRNCIRLLASDPNGLYRIDMVNCDIIGNDFQIASSDTPTYEPLVNITNCTLTIDWHDKEEFLDRKIIFPQNATGSSPAMGDVVTMVSTADTKGTRIQMGNTTTLDDENVLGVVAMATWTDYPTPVLVQGFCYHVKVNGETDIATDDLLGTFTTAKIAAKSTTRGARFAKAIGSYSTDDSSGVIKAYLFGHMR